MKKLLVFLVALGLSSLLAEGALSLFLGTSLRRIGRERPLLERLEEQDLAGQRAAFLEAARTVGPYFVPADPLVANTLRPSAELDYLEQRIRTDALGLRARPGPPPDPAVFHVVVLGDSVAYGLGLAQEENLAAQLEGVLRASGPAGAPEVVCSTVAVPGWNPRNAARHLLDHLERIAPDLVLFVPVENDLDDSYGVTEAGQRRRIEDPGVPHPLCRIAPALDVFRTLGRRKLGPRGLARREDETEIERYSLLGGLTEEARWRYEDVADTLAGLARRLERVGARLVLAPYHAHDLQHGVRARLSARGIELPVLALLADFRHEDGLGKDPHPNAETTRALALWAAEGLFAQGLLPFAPASALPEVPERFAGRRAFVLPPAELARWRADFEGHHATALVARVEPAELLGLNQIYGGVNADGTLGLEAVLVLPPGRRLRVELNGALVAPGLYPLGLALEVDGQALGRLELAHENERGTFEFELGPAQGAAPFEVRIRAEDWALARVNERLVPAAAGLGFVESLP